MAPRNSRVGCRGRGIGDGVGDGVALLSLLRRSTVEVRPEFSEASHLRSSLPHPKNDLSKNQIASR